MLTLTQGILWREGDYSNLPNYLLNTTFVTDSELNAAAKSVCDLALRSLAGDWWHAEPAAMHLGIDMHILRKLLCLAPEGDSGYEVFWDWDACEGNAGVAGFKIQPFQAFPTPGSIVYHNEHALCVVVITDVVTAIPARNSGKIEMIPLKTLWAGESTRLRLSPSDEQKQRRFMVPDIGKLLDAEAAIATWEDASRYLNGGGSLGGQPLDSAAWARIVWGGTHGRLNPQFSPRYCPPWHPDENLTYFRDGTVGAFTNDADDNAWDSIAEYEAEMEEYRTR